MNTAGNNSEPVKNKSRYERVYSSESMLFVEGETGSRMFIIRSGKIRVLKKEGNNSIELTVLGAGSVLGELTLLDNQPYNVTAEVIEDTVVTIIDKELLKRTYNRIPSWLGKLVQSIVKRLAEETKKASNELVQKSVSGVIRVLLLLEKSEGWDTEGGHRGIDLDRAKEMVLAVTGMEGVEAENVFLHLTIKGMILICKNSSGSEYICIKDHRVLSLYMNYLRAHQCGSKLTGENFPDEVFRFAKIIINTGEQNGRRSGDRLVEVDLSQIESGIELQNSGCSFDMNQIDQLVESKLIFTEKVPDNKTVLIYNPKLLKQLCLLQEWIAVFKEEIII